MVTYADFYPLREGRPSTQNYHSDFCVHKHLRHVTAEHTHLAKPIFGHSHGALLQNCLAGLSCGTLLRNTLAGHSCRTLLWSTLVGHSCRTFLWDTLAGHSCGTLLFVTLVEHSCRTLLWDTLVGHSRTHLWLANPNVTAQKPADLTKRCACAVNSSSTLQHLMFPHISSLFHTNLTHHASTPNPLQKLLPMAAALALYCERRRTVADG